MLLTRLAKERRGGGSERWTMMALMKFTLLGGEWESYSIVQKKRHYPAISTPKKARQGSEPMANR